MLICKHCKSTEYVRAGKATHGPQQYKCKNCKRNFIEGDKRLKINPELIDKKYEAFRLYKKENYRRNELAKKFNRSLATINNWLKQLEREQKISIPKSSGRNSKSANSQISIILDT